MECIECVTSPSAKSQIFDKNNMFKDCDTIEEEIDEIPYENVKKIKIPNYTSGVKKIKLDETMKTLKKNFNATLAKNYKNYFKYKSNLVDKKDINFETISENVNKSRNKTKHSFAELIDKDKNKNMSNELFKYMNPRK
jgi:hypothetical protein